MQKIINYLNKPGKWEQGIYALDSYDQYASIPALRSSELKLMNKTPAHYRAAILHKRKPSAQLQRDFDKGSAFDALILHGEEALKKRVVIEPDIHRGNSIYKEWRDAQAGKLILSADDLADIYKMKRQAMKKKQFTNIFQSPGIAHRVIIWQCRRTGIWCKSEIDWITENGIIVDLKTSADSGFWFFQKQAKRFGYLNQAAFYLEGLSHVMRMKHDDFLFAVVETNPPFESNVYRPNFDQIYNAQHENWNRIDQLCQCLEHDHWPGYYDQIIDLDSGQYEGYLNDSTKEDEDGEY